MYLKVIPMKYFNNLGNNWLVFNMNIDDIKNLPKANNLPAFYRDILMSWVKTGGGQLPSAKQILGMNLLHPSVCVSVFPFDLINQRCLPLQIFRNY
jgi:hypothetical protein